LMVLSVEMAASYSYMMLTLPASKVSVPFTVVMRTRSSAPERVTFPPPHSATTVLIDPETEATQRVELTASIVSSPLIILAALP